MIISAIQSLQIQQDLSPPKVDNATAASTNVLSSGPSNAAQTVQGQLQGVMHYIDTMMQQLDPTVVYYPPFFPISPPPRMDWINKLNHAQDKVEKMAARIGKGISFKAQTLSGDATDAEIVGTIQKLATFRKEAASIAPTTHESKTGEVVSIKV